MYIRMHSAWKQGVRGQNTRFRILSPLLLLSGTAPLPLGAQASLWHVSCEEICKSHWSRSELILCAKAVDGVEGRELLAKIRMFFTSGEPCCLPGCFAGVFGRGEGEMRLRGQCNSTTCELKSR